MRLIACLITVLVFFYLLEKPIKKHATLFYIATIIISVLSVLAPKKGLPFVIDYLVKNILARGTLAGALFILVMVASVCPAAKLRGLLLRTRGEMAIIAALLTLIHNISYGKHYFVALFTKISDLDAPRIFAAVLSLVMIVLLIPLTLTSFMVIRKKMNPKKWKSLQRLSYIFYGLLFIHISMIFSISIAKGHLSTLFDLSVYVIIYIAYLICRAKKYEKQRVLCILFMVLICALYIPIAVMGFKGSKTQKENVTTEENVSTKASSDAAYKDGTYEGSATGYSGQMTVSVTVSCCKISEINIVDTGDDEEYLIDAKDVIPQIIEKQSTEVDAVSGATHSSKGIINAVAKALESAKE
ncbi:FMN-binding protein [Lachnoanaerobaculum sp.]